MTMLFSCHDQQYSVLVKSEEGSIQQAQAVKFLGIYMDSHLSWCNHIKYITKKLSTHCYVIRYLRNFVTRSVIMSYYFAYVNSLLSYGIVAWGGSQFLNDVLIAQKRIVRSICSKSFIYPCRDLFVELNILTVASLYILYSVAYIHSNRDKYCKFGDNVFYNFRNDNTLLLPTHRLALTHKNSYILPITLYNHLPNSIKNLESIVTFRKTVKKLLIVKAFYSVEEFLKCEMS